MFLSNADFAAGFYSDFLLWLLKLQSSAARLLGATTFTLLALTLHERSSRSHSKP